MILVASASVEKGSGGDVGAGGISKRGEGRKEKVQKYARQKSGEGTLDAVQGNRGLEGKKVKKGKAFVLPRRTKNTKGKVWAGCVRDAFGFGSFKGGS